MSVPRAHREYAVWVTKRQDPGYTDPSKGQGKSLERGSTYARKRVYRIRRVVTIDPPGAAPRCVAAVRAMSKTSPTAAFHHAPRRIGRRLLRSFAFSAGVIAAAAAGAFLASQGCRPYTLS